VVRRFLSRSSITNRLVGLLLVSVVLPGLMLAWYSVKAVLQEETLYEATLRERAQDMAQYLYRDLGERTGKMLETLDAAAEESGAHWFSQPLTASERLQAAEPLVASVLVLDSAEKLRFPTRAATGLMDRRSGQVADANYLRPLLNQGERLEVHEKDFDAAATAYGRALTNIPGQRGRGIARLARARSLLKAGRAAEALVAYDELARDHVGDLDLNDFPLDLLARYQAALALLELDQPDQAGIRLTRLGETLLSVSWTYGGYGETALARRWLELVKRPDVAAALPDDALDLAVVRQRLEVAVTRQALEATVLAVLPALASDAGREGVPLAFELGSIHTSEGSLLFAHRWIQHRNQRRHLIVPLDRNALREDIGASLTTAQRANPEFATALVINDPTAPLPGGSSFRVVHPLDPWLPGYALVVSRGSGGFGAANRQQRAARIAMIGALLIIIMVGIIVIGRLVSREVEIARLKSDFVSNVSHELRTPLTTIRIMAEMLALGAVPGGEKQAEYHKNIVSEAERLTRLINNVLDFARIEEGRKKFKFGMGDIGDAVYEVERITGDYVRKEGFTLVTKVEDGLPATAFDRDAMIQALINLMSNAVKYSGEDKRIEMGVERDRDTICIYVADHGPGIDQKEIPHLFEKFYRGGDHMTREAGGTGLGLSIVQHITSAHGGKVSVDSRMGIGSRFQLMLPISQVSDLAGPEKRR
jgi:signal transduction histidine kinase